MLGVNSPREPITPEFSKEIRASLRRAMTGQLNEKEKAARQRLKDSEKYWTMEWKGLHFQAIREPVPDHLTLAGCQFLTVEALATKEYSAVGFYERCGFAPNEVKKPYKDTLRMYMTLYSKDEVFDE